MITQKDLIAESGLKPDAAITALKRLRRKGEITAEKDPFKHNRISYSAEDADKIRKEFVIVKAKREGKAQEGPPKVETKKEEKDDQAKPKGGSAEDKSVEDFVEQPGPEKDTPKPKKEDEKKEEEVPLYKNPIVYLGAGLLLLLGLMWLYQQRQKKQQVKSRAAEVPPPSAATRPPLADQYRIM